MEWVENDVSERHTAKLCELISSTPSKYKEKWIQVIHEFIESGDTVFLEPVDVSICNKWLQIKIEETEIELILTMSEIETKTPNSMSEYMSGSGIKFSSIFKKPQVFVEIRERLDS